MEKTFNLFDVVTLIVFGVGIGCIVFIALVTHTGGRSRDTGDKGRKAS